MRTLTGAIGAGTLLQVVMVVVGHYWPAAQQVGLFPIAGTLIGAVTGWLAGKASPRVTRGVVAGRGAVAGGVAGALGSLLSTLLGDVPLSNIGIAGGSTLVMGALGAILSRRFGKIER